MFPFKNTFIIFCIVSCILKSVAVNVLKHRQKKHIFHVGFTELPSFASATEKSYGEHDRKDKVLPQIIPHSNIDIYSETDKLENDVSYIDESDQRDEFESIQYQDKIFSSKNDDVHKFISVSYDEKSKESNLDAFGTEKLGTTELGPALPIFLLEPESTFVVKSRPAVLKCKAAHALQLLFKCSGSSHPPSSTYDKHVDPHTGVHLEEVTAVIYRDLVDEYFGKAPFKCECHAWSSRGVAKTQAATITVAYIKKQFTLSPTSLRVELGSRAEMHCSPPNGIPAPKVTWYKNDVLISGESGITVSIDGLLTLNKVSLQDMANYTCSAENVAGKRISESAVLIVYVNGGWSVWSPWVECRCNGKQSQGRKRTRTCSNPIAMNGGLQCSGPQIQKSPDCVACPEDTQIVHPDSMNLSFEGKWSSWSDWSICSSSCIQLRRRKCIAHTAENTALPNGNTIGGCSGKDVQTAECRGEQCRTVKDDFDWLFYIGLTFISAICLTLSAALVCCARHGLRNHPQYSIARTAMEPDYIQRAGKKTIRMQLEDGNVNYDYVNPSNGGCILDERINNCAMPEHHYDVPNLSVNYTNPQDDLSAEYLSDTVDTSSCTSDSTYDVTNKLPTLSVSKKSLCKLTSLREVLSCSGGCLKLYKGHIMLYVPELAIGKNQKIQASLLVLSDDNSRIRIPITETLLTVSTITFCAPVDYIFLKPAILKIPHCLVDHNLWNISIYHSENHIDDLNVVWQRLVTIGEETSNTPIFVHLDINHAYIMTEQIGGYVILAEPIQTLHCASINMKLIAFSQLAPNCNNCSLRIYIVKNFPNSKDICSRIESQLGGTYMGESRSFTFLLNNCSLKIRLRTNENWDPINNLLEQIIPYNHILSNNSVLHCEFSLKRNEQLHKGMYLDIDFSQSKDNKWYHTFTIPHRTIPEQRDSCYEKHTISIDKQGNLVNDIDSIFLIPRITKQIICNFFDNQRTDKHDWRLLAKKLNVDRNIAYFAAKASPTEQILNLWECKSANSSAIIELITALKAMNRDDVVKVIEQTVGPLWF